MTIKCNVAPIEIHAAGGLRMRRTQLPLAITMAFLLAFAAGCMNSRGSKRITEFHAGGAATYVYAPEDGTYELNGSSIGGGNKGVYELSKGDSIGFRPGESGKVIAVAGPYEIELPDAGYYWQKR